MATYNLTQTQLGIYLACAGAGNEDGNYNLDMLFRLDPEVDLQRLRSSLEAVIAAHPYVKSRIVEGPDGAPVFEDRSEEDFKVEIQSINTLDEARPRFGADYNLLADRLFRLEIYKTETEGNWLYVDFHHIIFDGMSWSVFREDLAKAYDGAQLEKETVDGFRISLDEEELRSSDFYREAKDWYVSEFGPAAELDSMPLQDCFGPEDGHFVKLWQKLDIDLDAAKRLCAEEGVSETALYTSAFGFTLSKFICENEVLFTSAWHGRPDRQTRHSFTMMVKTLPVYLNPGSFSTVGDFLRKTGEQTLLARRYSVYSFADAHEDIGINTDVSFVYQGALHDLGITLGGKPQHAESLVTHTPGFKFLGMLMIEDGAPYIWSEYKPSCFSENFVKGFWESFAYVVRQMCSKELLSDIELSTPAQTAVLDSFNASYRAPEPGGTVLDAFREAARLHPDNTAAASGTENSLTGNSTRNPTASARIFIPR